MNSKTFNDWLAGIIEGDGSIVTPEVRVAVNGKKRYPHIQVAFNKKDMELVKKIVGIVGGGSIDLDKNTVRLTWRTKEDLKNVIERINGRMRTPKILRLHKLIDWYAEEGLRIEKQNIDTTPIEENAWLSGMSDADSNFNIIITDRKASYRVQRQWRLEVSQKTYHGSEQREWIELVALYLKTNLLTRIREAELGGGPKKTYASYMTVAHSGESLKRLEDYIEKFPLKSSKYLDYKDWKNCGVVTEKTPENYKKIQEIKNGMNSKRTKFNWDHLSD